MRTHRLLTLVSAAVIAGTLLVPTMASAHGGRHDHWGHDKSERWSAPPRKHGDRHHHRKHDKRDRRHDRYVARSRSYADGPRRGNDYRDRPTKLRLGNGLTIIYR